MQRHLVNPLPLLAALTAALLTGCVGEEPAQEPSAVYSTRGMVRQLPKAPRAGAEIRILHEDMPEFRSEQGKMIGMESMSMPFPVAGPEMLEGLAVGDRVHFEFEVRWQGKGSPLLLTHIEKLPPETRLSFEEPPEEPEDEAPASQNPEDASSESEHSEAHGE